MTEDLISLIKEATKKRMSHNDKEKQRRSFAYGNAKIENALITRDMIRKYAVSISAESSNDE